MPRPENIIYLDEELRPNASLSRPAFIVVMGCVSFFSFLGGIAYLTIGAWPVFGFFGLDLVAIGLAFRVSFRTQKQVTYVRIDSECLRLWHKQAGQADKTADLPIAFVRIDLGQPVTAHTHLHIAYSDRAYVIGRFLTPKARAQLAERLRAALRQARNRGF